jgi:FtsP/CotA-like multicopper oxidase with cupredoxin domain
MRLINTSVDTTFVFAIDNHKIRVIGADFVPIKPYTTDHVLVGIGQRYHVIVEAQPTEVSEDGNYWIRFIPANGCDGLKNKVTTTLGIFRYEEDGHSNKTEPTTSQGDYSLKCHDEPYDSLVPILPWKVGPPINTAQNSQFEIALENVTGAPYFPADVTSRWNMFTDSLWINFSDPTLLHTGDASHIFKPSYVVINQTQSTNSWVYLLVSGTGIPKKGGFYPFVAHPIHLHGHDFAILEQSAQEYRIGNLNLNLNNPPRRDVALLPAKGYLVLAFKTDNPGAWLMHCHIAWHASSGLGLQILENPNNVVLSEESNNNMHQQCADWQEYLDSEEAQFLQDDSGV